MNSEYFKKTLTRKLIIFSIFCSFLMGCNADDAGQVKSTIIDVQLNSGLALEFASGECEFDDRVNSWSYNAGNTTNLGVGQHFITTHDNIINAGNSVVSFGAFLKIYFGQGQDRHEIVRVEEVFNEFENFDYNSETQLYLYFVINGRNYGNNYLDRSLNPLVNDYFEMDLVEYEVDYEHSCDDRKLLFLNINVKGKLYEHSSGEITDSIVLENSNLNLIFDIE